MLFSTLGYTQTASHSSLVNDLVNSAPNCGSYVHNKPKYKLPTHFGIQARTVLPTKFIGNPTTSIFSDDFESTISQRAGFGFGAVVRTGMTDLIALETGINFTQRHFDLNVAVPGAGVAESQSMSFVEYDVPINALFYVPLANKIFMNTSLGVAVNYKPSDTQVQIREEDGHYFSLYGLRKNSVGLDLNASVGFEYRTENGGFFYLGGSTRIPFQSLFQYAAIYDYNTTSTVLAGNVNGSFLSIDCKYFFPMRKK